MRRKYMALYERSEYFMLKIILVWWLIGLVMFLVIRGKVVFSDIKTKKYSVLISIVGTLVMGFMTPVYLLLGIIIGILELLNRK